MLRFVVVTWSLVGGWTWWVFAPKSGVVSLLGAVVLGSITVALARAMMRRASRLRAGHDYVNARLEYHSGMSSRRWKRAEPARDDDGGSEFTLGSGW